MITNDLETNITNAAKVFASEIVAILKQATLRELTMLQAETKPRRGRVPKTIPRLTKSGRIKQKPGPKPGMKKTIPIAKVTKAEDKTKKRNYPKCAYPGCNKNRFVRGNGFCGDHWKEWQAGKIKAAAEYAK